MALSPFAPEQGTPIPGASRSVAVVNLDRGATGRHLVAAVWKAANTAGVWAVLMPQGRLDGDIDLGDTPPLIQETAIGLVVIGDAGNSAVPATSQPPLPTVHIDASGSHPAAQIRIDYQASVAGLVRHVKSLGHQRVGYLAAHPTAQPDQWQRALARELLESDLFELRYFIQEHPDASRGYAGAQRLLDLPDPPSVIVCHDGRMALGIYRASAERGLTVPTDLSVMALSDTDLNPSDLWPPLDALHIPFTDMGEQAVRILLHKHSTAPAIICELITRSSSSTPRNIPGLYRKTPAERHV